MTPLTSNPLMYIPGLVMMFASLSCGHLIDFLPSHRLGKAGREESTEPSVCQTSECRQAGKDILAAMDSSVDPCEDFYTFACGGWDRANPVPPTEGRRGQLDVMDEMVESQIKALLESEKSDDEPAPVQLAKATYAACMDEEALESAGIAPLAELSYKLGSWPMASPEPFDEERFNPFQVSAAMKRYADISPLIKVGVMLDMKIANIYVIFVDQPGLTLERSILVDLATHSAIHAAYIDFITEVALVMATHNGLVTSRDKLKDQAVEVVDFEVELAKMTARNEMRNMFFRRYNPLSLKELQQWTDSASFGLKKPALVWLEFLRSIFADTNVDIETGEQITVQEVDFLFNLIVLIEKTPARTVANFLQWTLVYEKSADTTKQMRELNFQFEKLLQGTTEKYPWWKVCGGFTSAHMEHAVGYVYIHKHFDKASKESAEKMIENIRAAFAERVSAADWMDQETKQLALEKVKAMTNLVAYPDWYNNRTALEKYYRKVNVTKVHFDNAVSLSKFLMHRSLEKLRKLFNKSEWFFGPQIVNAAYNPLTNTIVLPAGILHSPGFAKGRPEALNYGGIGYVIAHEIMHGFDNSGRQFDKNGLLAEWWSPETLDTYTRKAKCFRDQYGAYRLPELDEMLNRTVYINSAMTLGENIADFGGLDAAYRAHQRYVLENGREPALRGLEQFSSEQLFFIGAASIWCNSITKERLLQDVLGDPHSPSQFRVTGPLSNSVAFSKAFSCPSGSPMNPTNKCTIW